MGFRKNIVMDLYDAIQIAVSMVLDIHVNREQAEKIETVKNKVLENPDSFTIKQGKEIINGKN